MFLPLVLVGYTDGGVVLHNFTTYNDLNSIQIMKRFLFCGIRNVLLFVCTLLCLAGCSEHEVNINDIDLNNIQAYRLPDRLESGEAMANKGLDMDNDKIVFVNNASEFERVFKNYPDHPSIDFNKYKLLLVQANSSLVAQINKQLERIDDEKLNLTIKITLTQYSFGVTFAWAVGYIVPKGLNSKNVSLHINYQYGE